MGPEAVYAFKAGTPLLGCENGTSLKTGFMAQEALSLVSNAFQNIQTRPLSGMAETYS